MKGIYQFAGDLRKLDTCHAWRLWNWCHISWLAKSIRHDTASKIDSQVHPNPNPNPRLARFQHGSKNSWMTELWK